MSFSPARSNRSTRQSRLQPTSPVSHTSSRNSNHGDGVLFLKQNRVTFDAPTQKISVFFDECNREIISLYSGIESKTRVVFQRIDYRDKVEFLLPVEKRILSIKLNPTRTVLAYHVEKSNIELINVRCVTDSGNNSTYTLDDKRYIHASRTKNSKLLGFLWTGSSELVMITDISIEYYNVEANRRRVKHVKSFQSSTNWFVYQPNCNRESSDYSVHDEVSSYSILMVSTGSVGNSMQPYMFHRNQIMKLQRFDVEGNWHGSDKLELFERSITIASIYGRVRLLVLQHESLNIKTRGAQILVYTIDFETGTTAKSHTLDLDVSGRFAINVVDNLVIAHDQPSKSSFIFDIMIDATEKSDCPRHFLRLIDNKPLRPLKLADTDNYIDMYSLNWVFFQPNFIIDAKVGLLCTLHLDLNSIKDLIPDNLTLLDFLAHRKDSERIILSKCKEVVAKSIKIASDDSQLRGSPLSDVSGILDILSRLVITAPELGPQTIDRLTSEQNSEQTEDKIDSCYGASISQEDVQKEVFRQLEETSKEGHAQMHFTMSTLLEFIFFVRRHEKNVEFCIYEQLFKCLVNDKRYYQLIQMIRSEIFKDSKQLACLLLSLRNQYRPAVQLGLDMLHRLDCLTGLVESLCIMPDSVEIPSEITV